MYGSFQKVSPQLSLVLPSWVVSSRRRVLHPRLPSEAPSSSASRTGSVGECRTPAWGCGHPATSSNLEARSPAPPFRPGVQGLMGALGKWGSGLRRGRVLVPSIPWPWQGLCRTTTHGWSLGDPSRASHPPPRPRDWPLLRTPHHPPACSPPTSGRVPSRRHAQPRLLPCGGLVLSACSLLSPRPVPTPGCSTLQLDRSS